MISLERIRQRKLFQWAAAYLAGAWLTLQVLDIVGEPFALPDFVLRAATVLVGVGLFGVLVLAWYHGEKGRQSVSGVELLMLAGILLIAGAAVAWVNGGRKSTSNPAVAGAVPARTSSAPAADASWAEQGSIAVLPFVNMSDDPDQEYFSDGLTEELLNVLAQIPELRVAARTSAFSFKGRNLPVDSIGRVLKVAHLLEGSVRTAGDRMRITAQLVDARNGYHLWSATYDRGREDVFAVQDEISRAIVDQLRLKLASDGRPARRETADPEAHALLLKAIAAIRPGTLEASVQSASLSREAIRRDPRYARAHAQLAVALMMQAYRRQIPAREGYAQARAAAERALELDPDLPTAHSVLARILSDHEWDFASADEHFRHALAINPNEAPVLSSRASLLMRLRNPEESLQAARRAVELDPLSAGMHNNLGLLYLYAGRFEQAAEAYRIAVALSPRASGSLGGLALAYSRMGRHAEAVQAAERARREGPEHHFALATLGNVYARAGRRRDAERVLAELRAKRDVSPYLLAMVYVELDEDEHAFELLERGLQERDDFMPDLGVDPVFRDLRDDPRLQQLLRRIGVG